MTRPIEADEPPSARVIRRARALRKLRGWSAQTLAERCAAVGASDLNRAVLANLETGRRARLTLEETYALAAALVVDPSVLIDPKPMYVDFRLDVDTPEPA